MFSGFYCVQDRYRHARCHLKNGENVREEELRYLYEIANILPGFLEERGFTAEPARGYRKALLRCSVRRSDLITEITSVTTVRMIISPCISRFMITVPEAIWKYSCGPKTWMMLRRLVPPTI